MSDISTILWDVGGVLLTNGWDHEGRKSVLAHFNIDREQFEERHPEPNDRWERGLITAVEYMNETVFYEPRDFSHDDFLAAMKAESAFLPDSGIEVLAKLSESADFGLGMLNNEAKELNDYRLEQFRLRRYFDLFFSSCYVRLRKPGTEIYRLAVEVLQCEPGELLFIDDRAANVEAAASVGIHAIRYEGSAGLVQRLAEFGISLEAQA